MPPGAGHRAVDRRIPFHSLAGRWRCEDLCGFRGYTVWTFNPVFHFTREQAGVRYHLRNTTPPAPTAVYFVTAYRSALANAGSDIVNESQGLHQGDSVLTAHYAKNGRDIWAYLHRGNGVITLKVADAGAENLTGQFDKDCHVALYGVLFDFNKAVLKPESDSTLQRVLAMMQQSANLKLRFRATPTMSVAMLITRSFPRRVQRRW